MTAWHRDDVMVVVDGVRVRRDEADALGVKIPGASARSTKDTSGDEKSDERKPARSKGRAPANKARRVENKN